MKKLISCICVFVLILALAVPACAEDFEQNPRAELDGNTLRLTCGPELHITDNENHSQKEAFRLSKSLAQWEVGPATVNLQAVIVENFTIKKRMSNLSWDWFSGIFEGEPFAAISLQWTVTCPEGEAVWIDPSAALLRLPDGEPVPAFSYLSGLARFTKIDTENKGLFITAFALKRLDAKSVSAFDVSLPAPFGADLRPLSDPLILHVELLHND